MPDSSRKPKIWGIGFGIAEFLPDIIPDYSDSAEIRVIHKTFEEGELAARELLAAGEADVFIAAGANGAYLRRQLSAPVVQIKVSGFDILHALQKAREVSDRIAIFSYQTIRAELEEVKELLKVDIEQCFYTTPEDARRRVQELAVEGYRVVVGSSMVNRLAVEAGMAGVFLYSAASVRRAVEDAIDLARLAKAEEARREWLASILQHLDEAVAAVDREGCVQSANPPMAALLGVPEERALGRSIAELAPELSLEELLRSGEAELERIQRLGKRTLVVNRIPLREGGALTGAVITCQDANTIQRADRTLRTANRPRHFHARYRLEDIVGSSPLIRAVREAAARYARVDATVLIGGESGTGKELFAQGIHNASRRRAAPFVAINCAAVAETLLESELFGYEEGAFTGSRKGGKAGLVECAHTGTLFLDEIGDLPLSLQAKLLRVLQEKEVLRLGANDPTPVDVRIVAATKRNLRVLVAAGAFREDLFYRLNILNLHLPPLRERREDIPALAGHFLAASVKPPRREQMLGQWLPRFGAYAWPGNIRELENVVERLAVFCNEGETPNDTLLRSAVPELFAEEETTDLKGTSRSREQAHIRQVLAECGGDQGAAAKRLGISRTTLWRRLKA